MRLTARLVLIVMLAVTLITVVYGVLTVHREEERLKQRMRDQARALGRTLEEEVVIQWRRSGHAGVVELVQRRSVRYGKLGVRWVDPELPSADRRAAVAELLRQREWGQAFSLVQRDENGVAHLHTYYPVTLDGGRPGYLEFVESLEELESYKREIWYQLVALLGAFLACGGFVTLVGVRLVGRPLQQLIEKTERIGAGDFSRPLQLRGYAELTLLADALNRMCEQLRQSQERVERESAARLAAVEQLRHADRLKTVGRLASGVAHELGTPLNVVVGRAELIASGQLPEAELQRSAVAIQREVQRMSTIIRQLLDFARRGSPQRDDVDLVALVSRTLDLLQPLAHRRQIDLQLKVEKEPLTARVDPNQIQQVLTNLVDNALQAQGEGGQVIVRLDREQRAAPSAGSGPALSLGTAGRAAREGQAARKAEAEAASRAEREYCTLSVEDQGPGIAAEHLEHIFEPFYTTKDVGEGTGLGLSVSYGIVEDHGGWIDVASREGEGSRFTVYLPREL